MWQCREISSDQAGVRVTWSRPAPPYSTRDDAAGEAERARPPGRSRSGSAPHGRTRLPAGRSRAPPTRARARPVPAVRRRIRTPSRADSTQSANRLVELPRERICAHSRDRRHGPGCAPHEDPGAALLPAGVVNAADVMTCALAREVHPIDVVGVGLGTPLALCAALVAQRVDAPEATVLVGGAVSPRATLDQICAHEVAGRTSGYVPHLDTMDMAERQAMTLQFLRPAQVGGRQLGEHEPGRGEGADRALSRRPRSRRRAQPDAPDRPLPHRPRAAGAATRDRVPDLRGRRGSSVPATGRLGPTKLVTDLCVIFVLRAAGRGSDSVHPGVSGG